MPDRHPLLLVASSPHRVLDLFDTVTGEKVGRVSDLVAEPHEMAPDQGRGVVYIAHTYRAGGYDQGQEPAREISVVDVDRRAVVDVIDLSPFISPHDIEYNAANDAIYVGVEDNQAGNGVVIVDAATRKVVDHIPTEGRNSHWIAVPHDGGRCYVAHKEAPLISVLDLQNRKTIATIPVPGGSEELDVSEDGRWVFAATPQQTPPAEPGPIPSRLVRIDAETYEVTGAVELERSSVAVRTAPDGRVLVSKMNMSDPAATGKLWVIDGSTMSILGEVELDRMSFTIRVSRDSSTAYVANIGAGTVGVVDLHAYAVVRTLDCTPDPKFGGSHGLSLIE
jgi:DNA-binding beta-propeller fold protein YncE